MASARTSRSSLIFFIFTFSYPEKFFHKIIYHILGKSAKFIKVYKCYICLEVNKSIELDDGEVFLCKVRNVLVDEHLRDESLSHEEKIKAIKPAQTVGGTYFAWNGNAIGAWGEICNKTPKPVFG